MGREKCKLCKHYTLEYSPVYRTYISGCTYMGSDRSGGCKGAYKPKEKPKAYIKRGVDK